MLKVFQNKSDLPLGVGSAAINGRTAAATSAKVKRILNRFVCFLDGKLVK
jgi:hypothetical protein